MESELWSVVYQVTMDAARNSRSPRVQHSDAVIVLTYLWAVLHDRPVSWACRPGSWPRASRRRPLPSPSCMSRRLRTPAVRGVMREVERRLVRRFGATWYKCIDGRPLAIGWSSKDRQARVGRAAGGKAKGYKLHAVMGAGGVLEAWMVLPMNVHEARAGRHLVRQLQGEGYVAGDSPYDSNPLHGLASRHHHQLVARLRPGQQRGHRPQDPSRLRAVELQGKPFGQALLEARDSIDRCFGNMSSFGGGLAPLPSWVRTYSRVRLWVHAKIIFNTARLWLNRRTAA